MVFITAWAIADSLVLLIAMSGMAASSGAALKSIADLEYDLTNATDFLASFRFAQNAEYVFLAVNFAACVPFLFNWWMALPQAMWMFMKMARLLGSQKIEQQELYKKRVYEYHRKWQIAGFFFYLISWFIYFARAVTAVMDIHVHGISPYD
mmetsp:Transcript_103382/g.205486  ORF Transcript_103382/g.205486 Transcript_103382/m.205486 type:complete len:151 (-) Transcript_103382:56-508(-)